MHELGHTLGLGHGGPAYDTPSPPFGGTNYNMNCKPNYFSVMSYSRQVPTASLPAGNTINDWDYVRSNGAPTGGTSPNLGTSTWPGTALDFERAAHADLNEASGLVERGGIPTVTATNDPTRALKFVYKKSTGALGTSFTGQDTDWNGDNTIATDRRYQETLMLLRPLDVVLTRALRRVIQNGPKLALRCWGLKTHRMV